MNRLEILELEKNILTHALLNLQEQNRKYKGGKVVDERQNYLDTLAEAEVRGRLEEIENETREIQSAFYPSTPVVVKKI